MQQLISLIELTKCSYFLLFILHLSATKHNLSQNSQSETQNELTKSLASSYAFYHLEVNDQFLSIPLH